MEGKGSDAILRVVRSDAAVQRGSAGAAVAPAGNDPAAAEAHKAEGVFEPGESFYPPNLPEPPPQSPSMHKSRRRALISAVVIVAAAALAYLYLERPKSIGGVEAVVSPAQPQVPEAQVARPTTPITHTPKATEAVGRVAPAADIPVAIVPHVTHTQPLSGSGVSPEPVRASQESIPALAPRAKNCSEQAALLGLCQ